jgi:hypothetical protein
LEAPAAGLSIGSAARGPASSGSRLGHRRPGDLGGDGDLGLDGLREAALRSQQVSLVGPAFDLATDAAPVRLVGVVPLQDHLEAKPHRSVADLLLSQHLDAPLDVLLRDGGRHLLDAHEVLLVERAQAIDAGLELAHQCFDLARIHRGII